MTRFPFSEDDPHRFWLALADIYRSGGEEYKAAAIERRADAMRDREKQLETELADALCLLEDNGIVPRE
jgi:hypothetical protein